LYVRLSFQDPTPLLAGCARLSAPSLRCITTASVHQLRRIRGPQEQAHDGELARIVCVLITLHECPPLLQHLDPRLRRQRLPTASQSATNYTRTFFFLMCITPNPSPPHHRQAQLHYDPLYSDPLTNPSISKSSPNPPSTPPNPPSSPP